MPRSHIRLADRLPQGIGDADSNPRHALRFLCLITKVGAYRGPSPVILQGFNRPSSFGCPGDRPGLGWRLNTRCFGRRPAAPAITCDRDVGPSQDRLPARCPGNPASPRWRPGTAISHPPLARQHGRFQPCIPLVTRCPFGCGEGSGEHNRRRPTGATSSSSAPSIHDAKARRCTPVILHPGRRLRS